MRWLLALVLALAVSQAHAQGGSTVANLQQIPAGQPLLSTDRIYVDDSLNSPTSCDGHGNCAVSPVQMLHVNAGTVTIGGTSIVQNTGLYISITPTGTSTSSTAELVAQGFIQPKNAFECPQDSASTVALGADMPCLSIHMVMGGGAMLGNRNGIDFNEEVTSNPYTTGKAPGNVGIISTTLIEANLGGTGAGGNSAGAFYSFAGQMFQQHGATWIGQVFGAELDVGAAGTAANILNGSANPYWLADLLLSSWNQEEGAYTAVHGSNVDTAIWFTNLPGDTNSGFTTIFRIASNSIWMGAGTGEIMLADPMNINNGIDLSLVSVNVDYLILGGSATNCMSPCGFTVDKNGNVIMNYLLAYGGAELFIYSYVTSPTGFAAEFTATGTASDYPIFSSGTAGATITTNGGNLSLGAVGNVILANLTGGGTQCVEVSNTGVTSGVACNVFASGLFTNTITTLSDANLSIAESGTYSGAFVGFCPISTCGTPGANSADELIIYGDTPASGTASVGMFAFGAATDINIVLKPQNGGTIYVNTSAGVSCPSGTPSSSFATVDGIVTHC